ncbi:MAG: ribulose-phosphate 3-epimerase [Dehalococcoidia bacterium]|jgi:ribulose-phosphate 3-epimerase
MAKASSPKIKIAPSILSADFSRLRAQVEEVSKAGADYIHVDIMDGHFVPPMTIGSLVVQAIRPYTKVPLDVHLMIEKPDVHIVHPLLGKAPSQIEQFAKAGANVITVHAEACPNLREVVEQIKKLGVKAGVSISPTTSPDVIEAVLPYVDLVLVMTVNPGYAGQPFIEEMVEKISRLRKMLDGCGLKAELEVDGGISPKTARRVVEAGARVLVAGAAIFRKDKNLSETMKELRASYSD